MEKSATISQNDANISSIYNALRLSDPALAAIGDYLGIKSFEKEIVCDASSFRLETTAARSPAALAGRQAKPPDRAAALRRRRACDRGAFAVPVGELRPRAALALCRAGAAERDVSLALAFGVNLSAVGRAFGRDRTTAAHACRLIEDRRDDPARCRAGFARKRMSARCAVDLPRR